MEFVRKRLMELKARPADILKRRDAANAKERTLLKEEDSAFKKSCLQLRTDLAEKIERLNAETAAARQRSEEKHRRNAARIEAAYSREKTELDQQSLAAVNAAEQQQQHAHERAAQEYDQNVAGLKERCEQSQAQLDALKLSAAKLDERIVAFGRRHGVRLDAQKPNDPLEELPADAAQAAAAITRRVTDAEQLLESSRQQFGRRMPALVPYAFIVSMHAGVAAFFYERIYNTPYVFLIGLSCAVALAIVYGLYHSFREKVWTVGCELRKSVSTASALIDEQKQLVGQRTEQGLADLENEKIHRILTADEKLGPQTRGAKSQTAERLHDLQVRHVEAVNKLARTRKTELDQLENNADRTAADLRKQCSVVLAEYRKQHAARRKQLEDEAKAELARLAAEWAALLKEVAAFGADAVQQCRKSSFSWSDPAALTAKLPSAYAEQVYAGDLQVDLKGLLAEGDPSGPFSIPPAASLSLPLALSYPLQGCLFVRAGSARREDAVRTLFGTTLRLLRSFPPGKVKLTVIDPVGLGQSFAALMHLSDYDESMVGGRIWSDSAHIDKRLTELTEHMEKVIQKYLRNRYESVADYNREAGQMAEPYRFLVIADFPAGFSELALERLASIVASGMRCGVYTLILHDERQKLPKLIEDAQLKANGVFLAEQEDGLIVEDPLFRRGKFIAEKLPEPEVVDAMLKSVGEQCRDAARVELPFSAAAPKAEAYWSASADAGIRVPLGRSGAERLQHLDLGRGMAQHALIAGKTGSGKSTLFHVIITNAALWYSPQELQFYLIDFKKGVEFKTYGTHRLPHARVIAIESDREFGISVLRRVDQELTNRGELFRQARVQDLPSYRKSNPGQPLPRTLLIIDEFQEFFVEDDSIAQDAALLLDRIVRQGRAFGIHVILGSQTLGGTYTLAKSTLGQMAVRIALQCNEADSYLILSDDNAAARLLSRPGEGIYNDMSGAIEGNNPFQVVWLAKETQDAYLKSLQQKSATLPPPAEPASIFEGNVLADIRNNTLLQELALRDGKAAQQFSRVWLGEPNAIKGPTEVEFGKHAGSNLLIVGQRAESAVAMCCSTVLCLAAGNSPENVRICVLDGTPAGSGAAAKLAALADSLPHRIEVVEYPRIPELVQELATLAKARQDGSDTSTARVYLLVLGLQKFRMLRQDDEFAFSTTEGESPAKHFADLLSEGPGNGIHSIVWCDTLGNLNRTFGRKTLREFEARVLFQMSATDSSELIDAPDANRLGLYNAVLFTLQDGGVEKFRPYAPADKEVIENFGRALKLKSAP